MSANPNCGPIDDDRAFAIICYQYALSESDIESVDVRYSKIKNKPLTELHVSLIPAVSSCPHCGSPNIVKHGKSEVGIAHNVIHHRNSVIVFERQRYRCKDCSKSFSEHNPFAMHKCRISLEMQINILEDLKQAEQTFASVGRQYGVSPQTVSNLFDKHVSLPRLKLPKRLLIDENFAIHTDSSDYILVLLDFDTRNVIDILPDRRRKTMEEYFLKIPLEERENVEAIGIDMSSNFKGVAQRIFPQATICVDHFHVVQEFNRRADEVRKSIMAPIYQELKQTKNEILTLKKRIDRGSLDQAEQLRIKAARKEELSRQYCLLKKYKWVLFKDPSDQKLNPGNRPKYNRDLNKKVNYNDIRIMLKNTDLSLKQVIEFGEDLRTLYTFTDRAEASEFFDSLVKKLARKSSPKPMQSFASTMRTWKSYILNSLDIVDTYLVVEKDGSEKVQYRHLNNGLIEQVNSLIKTLRKNANGMGSFIRFRNRIMYVLNKNSTYRLEPAAEKLAKQIKSQRRES